MEFESNVMALVALWLQQHGIAFGLGLLLGSIGTAVTFARKMIQLRRDGII